MGTMRATMSAFYTLHINTSLAIAKIEEVIDLAAIPDRTLNLGVHMTSARSIDIFASAFPFRPTMKIIYHLFPGKYDQGVRTMITTVDKLLTYNQSDLVLLSNADTTLLQRIQSTLILNDTDFWRPEYLALLPLSYTIATLPAL